MIVRVDIYFGFDGVRRKETVCADFGSSTIYATLFLLMKTSSGSFARVFTLTKSLLLSEKSLADASTYKGLRLLNTICSIIFLSFYCCHDMGEYTKNIFVRQGIQSP